MLELYGNIYTGDGTSQAAINKPFWAKVTAYDGVKYYAWTEYVPEDEVLVALPGGRFGTVTINPAWEPNSVVIGVNTYVLLRRADFSATYDWTYIVLAISSPGGFSPNLTGSTVTYGTTTEQLLATPGNPSNYGNTADTFLTLNPFTIFRYGPPSSSTSGGGILFTAPTEICGNLFWCCSPITLITSTYDDFDLTMGGIVAPAIVFDMIPNSPDTTLHGIQPAFYGPPTNTGAITNATNASPIVLTVPGWVNQPAVGGCVKVTGVLGNTNANGIWTVQASTGTTLTLKDSAGNAPFAASANSTIEMAGPQLIVLRNATAGTDSLIIDNLGGGGTSRVSSYVTLPIAYGASVTLAKNDTIILWWDSCSGYQWRVLACTVQHSASGSTGTNGESVLDNDFSVSDGLAFTTVNTTIPAGPLKVTLPVAGTYLLLSEVSGSMQDGTLRARLYNNTTSNDVPNTVVIIGRVAGLTTLEWTATIATIYTTISTNNNIYLQAQFSSFSATGATVLANAGKTTVSYVRLA